MTVLRYRGKRLEHGVIIAATLVLLFVSVYNIYLGFQNRKEIFQYEQKIANLQSKQDSTKKKSMQNALNLKKEEIESIKSQVVSFNRIIAADVFPWERLLSSMEKSIPSEVTLNKMITKNRFRNLQLNGRSSSVDSITLFLNNLEKSDLFQSVELANLNLNQSEQITFNISGRVDMKVLMPPDQYGGMWKMWN